MIERWVSKTSATMTVPRIPATAFGVRTSTRSPGRIRSRATATRPLPTSTVATPGTSVMVTAENSRTVKTDRPWSAWLEHHASRLRSFWRLFLEASGRLF